MNSVEIDLTTPLRAWHFTERSDVFRDGRKIPPPGTWLAMGGDIAICQRGLHYSRRAIDALQYAPGNFAHLVEVAGVVTEHADKGVCRARRIVASMDAETLLRDFARACASDVLHLWNAPQIVRDWLATGDESLRYAARDAARDAAWDAARNAAWAAAWDAAWDAAWAAARDAAWAAARDATRAAAWDAARDAQNARLESMLLAAMGVQP